MQVFAGESTDREPRWTCRSIPIAGLTKYRSSTLTKDTSDGISHSVMTLILQFTMARKSVSTIIRMQEVPLMILFYCVDGDRSTFSPGFPPDRSTTA